MLRVEKGIGLLMFALPRGLSRRPKLRLVSEAYSDVITRLKFL